MKTKCLHQLTKYVLITAILPFSWATLDAKGGPRPQAAMTLQLQMPPFQIIIEDPDCLGTPQFDLYSVQGELVGKAVACITSTSTTLKPVPVRVTTAHFTFNLPDGQIEADVVLREHLLSGSPGRSLGSPGILQTVEGTILGGNGLYVDIQGTLRGGGSITYTAAGAIMDVRYVFVLK